MTLNKTLLGAAAGGLMLAMAGTAGAQSTLRAVMHSDLKIVDPIWTTAYISRNYGYLVYDTLFAMDEQLAVQPQMVDSYEISDDNLTYTFTLRDGLSWHDGQPVVAEDAIASIKRWGEKDSMGQLLMSFLATSLIGCTESIASSSSHDTWLLATSTPRRGTAWNFLAPCTSSRTPNALSTEWNHRRIAFSRCLTGSSSATAIAAPHRSAVTAVTARQICLSLPTSSTVPPTQPSPHGEEGIQA